MVMLITSVVALRRQFGDALKLAAGACPVLMPGVVNHVGRLCLHCDGPVEPFARFERAGARCNARKRCEAEQDRQKVLAANLERNRISAAMQTEVLTTLESVIAQADEGLVMLNAEPAPDSDADCSAAFTVDWRTRACRIWLACVSC
ncbi:MAG: hypothetical protein ACLR5M_02785 [Bifidobacterium longum]